MALCLELRLLLFDRIQHGPHDWIVVDNQVSLIVFRHGIGNDLLHRLRAEADVLAIRLQIQGVIRLVLVAQRLQLHHSLESWSEGGFDVLQPLVGEHAP